MDEFERIIPTGCITDSYEASDYGRATVAWLWLTRHALYSMPASELHKASGRTWKEAADAAKALIDEGLYELYYDPSGERNYALPIQHPREQ